MNFENIHLKEFVDIPSSTPKVKLNLPLVGICQRPTNILVIDPFEKSVKANLYSDIRIACSLNAQQRGLHMSRIEECLEELKNQGLDISEFVHECAKLIQRTQGQKVCKVELASNYEKNIIKNPSGKPSKELLQLITNVEVNESNASTTLAVMVPFINACPCTQRWGMREYYETLRTKGYDHSTSEDLVRCAPLQAHTNRGKATLSIGSSEVSHQTIYDVLDRSVPIIRELLKGQDEHSVVRHAHGQGQFCEDNIRAIANEVISTFRDSLPLDTKIKINVEVDESVHFHNLWAEIDQSLGQILALMETA